MKDINEILEQLGKDALKLFETNQKDVLIRKEGPNEDGSPVYLTGEPPLYPVKSFEIWIKNGEISFNFQPITPVKSITIPLTLNDPLKEINSFSTDWMGEKK